MPIHTPYDPEAAIGEFGWIWDTDTFEGGAWRLVWTIEPDGIDAELQIALADPGSLEAEGPYDPEPWRGAPYLPCSAPAAEPGKADALEVSLRLPDGAWMSNAIGDPGTAQIAKAGVIAALRLGREGAGD